MLRALDRDEPWDILIIGGGATGLGCAVDAAARGYATLLLEQADFGKGTSSRSTKLVHGGVRYLQQGNVALVMEALRERGILRRNAPHLVRDLPFVVPNYDWWEMPFYGIGLKVYDVLAGRYGFGGSKVLSRQETVAAIPTIETEGLRGGVRYHDGQFDDARLAVNLAQTAAERGAVLLNGFRVRGLIHEGGGVGGIVAGVEAEDAETGRQHSIRAKAVVNATGPFTDAVRRMDDPGVRPMIRPSQGVHVVLPREFLPADHAIMVPRTSDGRVLFAIPWHNRVVVGTTDTPIEETPLEPRAFDHEIDFILSTARAYLERDPAESDVLSVFVGIRPLVAAVDPSEPGRGPAGSGGGGDQGAGKTSAISRDHTLHIAASGLITIAGGKWTTYRKMAQDVVDQAAELADLPEVDCPTKSLMIHGAAEHAGEDDPLWFYGSDAPAVRAMEGAPGLGERLHPRLELTAGQVVWACRREMARTVDDVLARRTRSLLLDARAALEAAPRVAELMAKELGRGAAWAEGQVADFAAIAAVHTL